MSDDKKPIGRDAAILKRACGLSWKEVHRALSILYDEEVKYSRARSAARSYERNNSQPSTQCPTRFHEAISRVRSGEGQPEDVAPVDSDSASFVVDGNEAELTVSSRGPIRSLPELIDSHRIDTRFHQRS